MKIEAMKRLRATKRQGPFTYMFLSQISDSAKNEILDNIAKHYKISRREAFEEVTDDAAEHLLDYVTGPARAATSVLMQKHHFATKA